MSLAVLPFRQISVIPSPPAPDPATRVALGRAQWRRRPDGDEFGDLRRARASAGWAYLRVSAPQSRAKLPRAPVSIEAQRRAHKFISAPTDSRSVIM